MGVTGRQIAETTLEAYRCGGGYIWGQSGATWTQEKQDSLVKKYNADPVKYSDYAGSVKYGKKWIGHRVWDCSGLTMWAAQQNGISYHHGSNSMWNYDNAHKGKLTSKMELPAGAYVYTGNDDKKPHIGTYTGDGLVTEAAGSNAGVIQSKLHAGKWKYWSLGKGIDYDFIPDTGQQEPEKPKEPEKPAEDQRPTLRKGSKGAAVKKAQQLLLDRGYKLPKYGADGDFGNETLAAVKQFQRDWGLDVDGVIGPATWRMLESTPAKEKRYTITIRGLSEAQANELAAKYPGSAVKEETG